MQIVASSLVIQFDAARRPLSVVRSMERRVGRDQGPYRTPPPPPPPPLKPLGARLDIVAVIGQETGKKERRR